MAIKNDKSFSPLSGLFSVTTLLVSLVLPLWVRTQELVPAPPPHTGTTSPLYLYPIVNPVLYLHVLFPVFHNCPIPRSLYLCTIYLILCPENPAFSLYTQYPALSGLYLAFCPVPCSLFFYLLSMLYPTLSPIPFPNL